MNLLQAVAAIGTTPKKYTDILISKCGGYATNKSQTALFDVKHISKAADKDLINIEDDVIKVNKGTTSFVNDEGFTCFFAEGAKKDRKKPSFKGLSSPSEEEDEDDA